MGEGHGRHVLSRAERCRSRHAGPRPRAVPARGPSAGARRAAAPTSHPRRGPRRTCGRSAPPPHRRTRPGSRSPPREVTDHQLDPVAPGPRILEQRLAPPPAVDVGPRRASRAPPPRTRRPGARRGPCVKARPPSASIFVPADAAAAHECHIGRPAADVDEHRASVAELSRDPGRWRPRTARRSRPAARGRGHWRPTGAHRGAPSARRR